MKGFRRTKLTHFLLLLGLLTTLCLACIWDSDTIDDEVRGLPDTKNLISNRWHRHGEAYYLKRIQRLEAQSKLSLEEYDDLAVAFERVGEQEKALLVLQEKFDELQGENDKEHLYRYYANRGTVLAHSRRYQEALRDLESALAINPEAHFGRENYQILAIKYILAGQKDPSLWEKDNFLSYSRDPVTSPNLFRTIQPSFDHGHYSNSFPGEEELQAAFDAVAGMLRFGGREGPELYRTLADISLAQGDLNTAWYLYRIAIRKEHPASHKLEEVIAQIEKHWDESDLGNPPTKKHFERVMVSSKNWLRAFQKLEEDALIAGEDPSDPTVLSSLLEDADDLVPALPLSPTPSPWEPYEKVPPFIILALALALIAHILGNNRGAQEL